MRTPVFSDEELLADKVEDLKDAFGDLEFEMNCLEMAKKEIENAKKHIEELQEDLKKLGYREEQEADANEKIMETIKEQEIDYGEGKEMSEEEVLLNEVDNYERGAEDEHPDRQDR